MSDSDNSAAEKIFASSKYAPVDRSVIERILAEATRRYGPKRAAGEAKRLLHQVWGMYYGSVNLRAAASDDLAAVLRLHQSTKERLPFLKAFYDQIFAITGGPRSIADYACGLNPVAFASLGYGFPARYAAYDIDIFTVNTLNAWFEKLQIAGQYTAQIGDLITSDPEPADAVLLLKVLPVLELQSKGSSRIILNKQTAKYVVISYPLKSVSGKEKGMASFYRTQFYNYIENTDWRVDELEFQNELVFVLRRHS